jgi:hypothetical protein
MSVLADLLAEVFREPTLAGVARELATLAAPLWLAALVGLLIGWAWRPRWAAPLVAVPHQPEPQAPALPPQQPAPATADKLTLLPRAKEMALAAPVEDAELAVNAADLKHLRRVVDEKDGGPAWIHMMDRTLPTFRYQAWRRDMEVCKSTFPSYKASLLDRVQFR